MSYGLFLKAKGEGTPGDHGDPRYRSCFCKEKKQFWGTPSSIHSHMKSGLSQLSQELSRVHPPNFGGLNISCWKASLPSGYD